MFNTQTLVNFHKCIVHVYIHVGRLFVSSILHNSVFNLIEIVSLTFICIHDISYYKSNLHSTCPCPNFRRNDISVCPCHVVSVSVSVLLRS